MDTCFLFTKHLNDKGCYALQYSESGDLKSKLKQQNFEALLSLKGKAKIVLVESAEQVSIQQLDLPWLPEKKARAAIPYALEEKLAEPVQSLHFAFDKQHYENQQYLILVMSLKRIKYLLNLLAEKGLHADEVTVDWFALNPGEALISEDVLLVNEGSFKGALKGSMAQSYLKQNPALIPLAFKDSCLKAEKLVEHKTKSAEYIAQKLLINKPMNLLQGSMQHDTIRTGIKKAYQLLAAMTLFWLGSLILVQAIEGHQLTTKNKILDQQIAEIYHQFFPKASEVISPKFRIEQQLKTELNQNAGPFWQLLSALAGSVKNTNSDIEALNFRNNKLGAKLYCKDFESLNQIEEQLKKEGIKVVQIEASTIKGAVHASLELS